MCETSFGDINTLKVCPFMPYHDPDRPYVNYWFAASEGPTIDRFNSMVSEENQDRLARGAAHASCIRTWPVDFSTTAR